MPDMPAEKITVLASHAATHGYEIFLQQGVEGSGPPAACRGPGK